MNIHPKCIGVTGYGGEYAAWAIAVPDLAGKRLSFDLFGHFVV